MNFVLDTISVDSFYHNLLVGISKLLTNRMEVTHKHLARFPSASAQQISEWEAKNGAHLPLDLKKFYASTNGFYYKWVGSYGTQKLRVQGHIEINNLDKLQALKTEASKNYFGEHSKVFELCALNTGGKVVLLFLDNELDPTVWLCTSALEFHHLAENFTAYFRMAIAHLGFPNWQMLCTPEGVPEWTRVFMRLNAPNLLACTLQKKRSAITEEKLKSVPVNALDPNVFFATRTKCASSNKNGRNQPSERKRYDWVKSRYLKKGEKSAK